MSSKEKEYRGKYSDTDRLNFIESMGDGSSWIARHSSRTDGYRVHNTGGMRLDVTLAAPTIREALDLAIEQEGWKPEVSHAGYVPIGQDPIKDRKCPPGGKLVNGRIAVERPVTPDAEST